MATFAPPMAHGPIDEVFPGIYVVRAGFQMGAGMVLTRNMTILKEGNDLTIVNSARLTPAGEQALEQLGQIKHLVRIGAYHGADDPYYMDRYRPTLWSPPGMRHAEGMPVAENLGPAHFPLSQGQAFCFEHGRAPEATLLLPTDGGVLITCDCYQHWTTYEGCSLLAKATLWAMGFGPTLIGGPWARRMGLGVKQDFEHMVELPFRHLIPGHGSVLREEAREGLRTAMAKRFR